MCPCDGEVVADGIDIARPLVTLIVKSLAAEVSKRKELSAWARMARTPLGGDQIGLFQSRE